MIKISRLDYSQVADIIDQFNPVIEPENLAKDLFKSLRNIEEDVMVMTRGSEFICVGGFKHLRRGVAEVWLFLDKNAYKYKFEFTKAVKRMVDFGLNEMDLHRIEAAVPTSLKNGAKFERLLGFELEGVATNYDSAMQDHWLFARTK